MAEIQITSLKCPRCKHPLSNYDGNSAIVTCSECGEIIHISGIEKVRKEQEISRILPFSVKKEQFEERIETTLVKNNQVPLNVLTESDFIVHQYYIPVYVFNGSYSADYDYSRGYKTEEYSKILDKWVTKTEYLEESDTCRGSFCLYSLACDISKDSVIPASIVKAVNGWSYNFGKSKEYSSAYIKDIEGLVFPKIDRDAQESWSEDNHHYKVQRIAKNNITKRLDNLPDNSAMLGHKWKDMRFDVEISDTTYKIYLVPVWYATYQYQGSEYYVVASGCDDEITYTAPKDSAVDDALSISKKKWIVPLLLASLPFFALAVVVVLCESIDIDLALCAVAFGMTWWFIIRHIRNTILQGDRDRYSASRQKILKRLRDGGMLTPEDSVFTIEEHKKARLISNAISIVFLIAFVTVFIVYYFDEYESQIRTDTSEIVSDGAQWWLSGDLSAIPIVRPVEDRINIRMSKSTDSEKLGQLFLKDPGLVLVEAGAEWNEVFYKGDICYIACKYTIIIYPSEPKRQMIVSNDCTLEYLGEDKQYYYGIASDWSRVEKKHARLKVFEAKNGDGVLVGKEAVGNIPIYASSSTNANVISYLPKDEDGYLPEAYPCKGYRDKMFLIQYGEVDGWVAEDKVTWMADCTW